MSEAIDLGCEIMTVEPAQPLARTDPDALLRLAIEKQSSIDALERLMALRTQLKAEMAREAFFEAFAEFQGDCPIIGKHKVAQGKAFSYKFADISDVRKEIQPALTKHGLSFRFEYVHAPDCITSICVVSHRGGHCERTECKLPIDREAYMNDSQKIGSAQSYADRYSLRGALGLTFGGEDDDAQAASAPRPQTTTKATPVASQPPEPNGWKVGTIDDLSTESGVAKTGKPYTRYIVAISGQKHSLFDKDKALYDVALAYRGKEVQYRLKQEGKYWNLDGIRAVQATAPAPADPEMLEKAYQYAGEKGYTKDDVNRMAIELYGKPFAQLERDQIRMVFEGLDNEKK